MKARERWPRAARWSSAASIPGRDRHDPRDAGDHAVEDDDRDAPGQRDDLLVAEAGADEDEPVGGGGDAVGRLGLALPGLLRLGEDHREAAERRRPLRSAHGGKKAGLVMSATRSPRVELRPVGSARAIGLSR